jgi:hypothetical protein
MYKSIKSRKTLMPSFSNHLKVTQVKVPFFPVGDSEIELPESTAPDGLIAK